MAAEHKPNFILRILTELIWQADLLEAQSMRLDETMSFFEEQIGTCERSVHRAENPSRDSGSIRSCTAAGLAGPDLDLWARTRFLSLPAAFHIGFCMPQASEDTHPAELHQVRGLTPPLWHGRELPLSRWCPHQPEM